MTRTRKQTSPGSVRWAADSLKSLALAAGVIVTATALTYLGVVQNDFVNFDDPLHLEMNPHFYPASWQGLGRLWARPFFGEYVPLTYTLLAAEALFATPAGGNASGSPFDPAIFHAVSVALHISCAWLVFLLLQRLVHKVDAALAGALLFSLHPIQVESVAWVSETRGLLAAFWSLLAIGCYLSFAGLPGIFGERSRRQTGTAAWNPNDRNSWLHYGLATLFLILALLSKPSAVVVPLMAGVLDWSYNRRGWRATLVSVLPWLLLAGGCAWLTKASQRNEILAFIPPFWARPFIAGDALAFYLKKMVWPESLSVHYDHAPSAVMRTHWMYVGWLAPAALLAVTAAWPKLRPYLPMVALWMAGLVAVLGIIPFGFQDYSTVADRYMYLPMIGPALAAAWWSAGGTGKGRLIALVLLLTPLAVLSYTQVTVWRDSPTLYDHTLRINPRSWLAYFNRGVWKRDQVLAALRTGQDATTLRFPLDDAMHDFDQALVDAPRREAGSVYIQKASVYFLRGEQSEALAAYNQAIELSPHKPDAWYNRGVSYMEQKNFERSVADFSQAIALNPEFESAYLYRGKVLRQLGQGDAALRDFSRLIELRPENPMAYVHRAEIEESLNCPNEAIQDLSKAIELTGNLQLCQLRARLYAKAGDIERAHADLATLRRAGITPDPDIVRAVEQRTP